MGKGVVDSDLLILGETVFMGGNDSGASMCKSEEDLTFVIDDERTQEPCACE